MTAQENDLLQVLTSPQAGFSLPTAAEVIKRLKSVIGVDGPSTWPLRGVGEYVGLRKPITDIGPSFGSMMAWDGTYWRVTAPTDVVFDTTTSAGDLTGADQVIKSAVLPAGLLRACRYFGVKVKFGKSGTTDAATTNRVLIGAAGTTADDLTLATHTAMASGNRTLPAESQWFVASATQVRSLGASSFSGAPWPGSGTSGAEPSNVTVPNVDTTPIYISAAIDMAGTTDTPQVFRLIVTLYQ